jgi:poly-gamma-glutamate synthesis protein (capsule biosynthesis protein)
MSNFPLAYRLSWLPRLLKPSLTGDRDGFAPPSATWLDPPPLRTVRLAFVGDISAVANRAAPIVHPAIRNLLASADLVVGNCESPVVEKAHAPFGTAFGIRHTMSGRFLSDALEAAGIARERLVLSVANNHALDQGAEGFDETLAALGRLGIRAVGLAGEPVAKIAIRPATLWDSSSQRTPTPSPSPQGGGGLSGGTLTIGLAAFSQWRNAGREAFVGRVAMADDPRARPDEGGEGCDLVCALPHWDWEFRHFPRAETRAFAKKLVGGGAGLVIGGHAHVIQPVERVGNALVAYGLGDFLGTALARAPWPARLGALLTVDVSLDPATRGRVAGYRLHCFLRQRDGDHERLTPVDALEGPMRDKVLGRLRAVHGPAAAGPQG